MKSIRVNQVLRTPMTTPTIFFMCTSMNSRVSFTQPYLTLSAGQSSQIDLPDTIDGLDMMSARYFPEKRVWECCAVGVGSRASYGAEVNLAERRSRTEGSVVLIVPMPQWLEIPDS